jgi:hypothetical protein
MASTAPLHCKPLCGHTLRWCPSSLPQPWPVTCSTAINPHLTTSEPHPPPPPGPPSYPPSIPPQRTLQWQPYAVVQPPPQFLMAQLVGNLQPAAGNMCPVNSSLLTAPCPAGWFW